MHPLQEWMLLINRFWKAEWKHPVCRCEAPDAALQQAKSSPLQTAGAVERLNSMLRYDRDEVAGERNRDKC
jgi:hypothetical protein